MFEWIEWSTSKPQALWDSLPEYLKPFLDAVSGRQADDFVVKCADGRVAWIDVDVYDDFVFYYPTELEKAADDELAKKIIEFQRRYFDFWREFPLGYLILKRRGHVTKVLGISLFMKYLDPFFADPEIHVIDVMWWLGQQD